LNTLLLLAAVLVAQTLQTKLATKAVEAQAVIVRRLLANLLVAAHLPNPRCHSRRAQATP
jgi:hypothetical protein